MRLQITPLSHKWKVIPQWPVYLGRDLPCTETPKKAAAGEMPAHGRGWRMVGAENLSQLQLLGIGPRTGATTVAAEDSSQLGSTKAVGQPGLRAGRTQWAEWLQCHSAPLHNYGFAATSGRELRAARERVSGCRAEVGYAWEGARVGWPGTHCQCL